MSTALTAEPNGAISIRNDSPEGLLSLAIERGISVEGIEKLMVMAREVRQERARAAFIDALSGFQSECPVIEKTRSVMNKDGKTLRYKYAAIEDIKAVAAPILDRHGLSYSFDTSVADGMMNVVCKIQHRDGHADTSRFGIPIGNSGFMSEAQNFASSVTYAKRYALCDALGIVVGDEDNDGEGPQKREESPTKQTEQPKENGKPAAPPPLDINAAFSKWIAAIARCDTKEKLPILWEKFLAQRKWPEELYADFAAKLDAREKAFAPPKEPVSDTNGNSDPEIPF